VLRVFVVGEDPLAREALTRILTSQDIEVVGESGPELEGFPQEADVALLDLGIGPLAFPEELRERPLPVVVVLREESRAQEILGAGARGVLLRDGDPKRLGKALAAAAEGLYVLDEGLGDSILPVRPSLDLPEELTPRELEALNLLAQGLSNRGIASKLGITEHTAKFHVNSILGKLGAESRTEAVVRAARLGLVVL